MLDSRKKFIRRQLAHIGLESHRDSLSLAKLFQRQFESDARMYGGSGVFPYPVKFPAALTGSGQG